MLPYFNCTIFLQSNNYGTVNIYYPLLQKLTCSMDNCHATVLASKSREFEISHLTFSDVLDVVVSLK